MQWIYCSLALSHQYLDNGQGWGQFSSRIGIAVQFQFQFRNWNWNWKWNWNWNLRNWNWNWKLRNWNWNWSLLWVVELELELKITELELELNWKNEIDPNPDNGNSYTGKTASWFWNDPQSSMNYQDMTFHFTERSWVHCLQMSVALCPPWWVGRWLALRGPPHYDAHPVYDAPMCRALLASNASLSVSKSSSKWWVVRGLMFAFCWFITLSYE